MKILSIFSLINLLISPFSSNSVAFNTDDLVIYSFFLPIVGSYPSTSPDSYTFSSYDSSYVGSYTVTAPSSSRATNYQSTSSFGGNTLSNLNTSYFRISSRATTIPSGASNAFVTNWGLYGVSSSNSDSPLSTLGIYLKGTLTNSSYDTDFSNFKLSVPYLKRSGSISPSNSSTYTDSFLPIENRFSNLYTLRNVSSHNPFTLWIVFAITNSNVQPSLNSCDFGSTQSNCINSTRIEADDIYRFQINDSFDSRYTSFWALKYVFNINAYYQLDLSAVGGQSILPIYVGGNLPDNISSLFGVSNNKQSLLDDSNSSLSSQVVDLNSKQDNMFNDFNSNVNALDLNSSNNLLSSISASANYVRILFDSVTYETPWGSYLQYCLLIGFAILIIGRKLG